VELIKTDFDNKKVGFIFPPNRVSNIIRETADFTHKLKTEILHKFQLPDEIKLFNGRNLFRPREWR
jgi:hypothetical protein